MPSLESFCRIAGALWRFFHSFLRPCGSKPAELERSGDFFIHSLAQRTNQETSTPYQTTPYMGCLNQEVAEADDFLWVLASRW